MRDDLFKRNYQFTTGNQCSRYLQLHVDVPFGVTAHIQLGENEQTVQSWHHLLLMEEETHDNLDKGGSLNKFCVNH